jgi:RNA polymerase II C-terminal domain phosphatase-like 3/4
MAEQLDAVCCTDMDSTATHVVGLDRRTDKARWAAVNEKFLVNPRWVQAANFRWCRQPEEDFPVPSPKEKRKEKGNAVAGAGEKEPSKDEGSTLAGDAVAGAGEGNEQR